MKRILFAALLALPALGLAVSDASASWNICGQRSCSYSFQSPRFWFGFDCGCPPGLPGPHAATALPPYPVPPQIAPAVPGVPAARPETAQAPATQAASYYHATPNYYAPASNYAAPSYWYGR